MNQIRTQIELQGKISLGLKVVKINMIWFSKINSHLEVVSGPCIPFIERGGILETVHSVFLMVMKEPQVHQLQGSYL